MGTGIALVLTTKPIYGIMVVPSHKGEPMPYKNKEDYIKAYQTRNLKRALSKPVMHCVVCNREYKYKQGRSKSEACEECYTKYRSLYNLIHSAKYRAGKAGLEFDLDIQWAINQPNVCKYTGMELTYTNNGKNYTDRKPQTASIDKIDPTKGYTKDNCQIISWWFNCAKQQFSTKEVIELCAKVVNTCTT